MSDSQVQLKIPEELVRSVVMQEITKGLEADAPGLFAKMVAEFLTQPKDGYSRNEPVWEALLKDFLKEVSRKVFKDMLEEHREEISASLKKKLATQKISGQIAQALINGIGNAYGGITINFRARND